MAKPTQFLMLSGLSGDWMRDRNTVNRLRRLLRSDGYDPLLAWAIEPNPQDTGFHAHAWSYGGDIPERVLRTRAHQVGLVHSDVVTVTRNGNFSYVLKVALHNHASLAEHRRLNGSELIHARGFWRDGDTGESLSQKTALSWASSRGRPLGHLQDLPLHPRPISGPQKRTAALDATQELSKPQKAAEGLLSGHQPRSVAALRLDGGVDQTSSDRVPAKGGTRVVLQVITFGRQTRTKCAKCSRFVQPGNVVMCRHCGAVYRRVARGFVMAS